ncbi:MAG: hypothetical protein ACPIOQ_74045 [Promethearchaeia archaeon]
MGRVQVKTCAGFYSFLGEHVHPNEDVRSAVHRALDEELGDQVTVCVCVCVITEHARSRMCAAKQTKDERQKRRSCAFPSSPTRLVSCACCCALCQVRLQHLVHIRNLSCVWYTQGYDDGRIERQATYLWCVCV